MEELKLIMETIASIGGEAKWMFYVYIGKEVFRLIMLTGLVGGLLAGVYRLVNKFALEADFVGKIKRIMGFRGYLSESEREEIFKILRANKPK